MINANELRIGNIIYLGVVKEPIIVKGINPESPVLLNAEPIPLDEEWLLKFGFNHFPEMIHEFRKDTDCGFNISLSKMPYRWCFYRHECPLSSSYDNDKGTYITDRFKYVHQLQNLYFALTGEELTINQ